MMKAGEVEKKLGKRLEHEIGKWSVKIERKLKTARAANAKGEEFLKNINAYVSDSAHFLAKGDPVRSFEAIVWAWAWLEIGIELDLLAEQRF
jgi:hypothetical protein